MFRMLQVQAVPAPTLGDRWDREAYEALPAYPKLGESVQKLRRASPNPVNDRKLGLAVLDAINRMNRPTGVATAESLPAPRTGKQILASIRANQKAAAERLLAEDHRARTDAQVRKAYEIAMKIKAGELPEGANTLVVLL